MTNQVDFLGSDGAVAGCEVYEDLLKAGVVDPAKVGSDTPHHAGIELVNVTSRLRHGYVGSFRLNTSEFKRHLRLL